MRRYLRRVSVVAQGAAFVLVLGLRSVSALVRIRGSWVAELTWISTRGHGGCVFKKMIPATLVNVEVWLTLYGSTGLWWKDLFAICYVSLIARSIFHGAWYRLLLSHVI